MIVGMFCNACKNWAAFSDEMPIAGTVIESRKWIYSNGRPVKYGSEAQCPTCHSPLRNMVNDVHRLL
jgi:hypothetical protein